MQKFIKVGNERVPVSKEVHQAHYQMKRRMQYLERDVKVGKSVEDPETGEITFLPSKEDSIERLMDQGVDFADEQTVEDIVVDKAMLLLLQEAMAELDREELHLIESLYYKNLTVREVAKQEAVSHVAVVKRHKQLLDKLREFFS